MADRLKLEEKEMMKQLQKIPSNQLDKLFHEAHTKVFRKFDCLTCANCCKTTGPRFTSTDIQRLAKLFKLKTAQFIDAYLRLDEDGDYVLQKLPCAFLLDDNKCFIYDQRPLACKEYPHTNRVNMKQILKLTVKNTEICPAVEEIVSQIIVKK
ncbi:MAG: YkgJ family cysteine cluster protein [Crocinitomicaceae bacterium]|nr:YkgJ family cysteine cluster protein [Crocinitomicaceae bacterium]MBK8924810.1 YkgJ family cysteine cluster protein [Crocinitomicaceae bacterium]